VAPSSSSGAEASLANATQDLLHEETQTVAEVRALQASLANIRGDSASLRGEVERLAAQMEDLRMSSHRLVEQLDKTSPDARPAAEVAGYPAPSAPAPPR